MPTLPPKTDAILFDLDGTLVDSAADIATAANLMLESLDLAPVSPQAIESFIGDGLVQLIARALAAGVGADPWLDADLSAGQQHLERFRGHYAAHLVDETRFYPGVAEMLAHLSGRLPLGVVTNKPEAPARAILNALGAAPYFGVLVGGDTTPERKPSPRPLQHATHVLGVRTDHTILVGDGLNDARAGRAAGMFTLGVKSTLGRYPERIKAEVDLYLESMTEAAQLLREHFGR